MHIGHIFQGEVPSKSKHGSTFVKNMELSRAHESSVCTEGSALPDCEQFDDNGFEPIDQLGIAVAAVFIKR